MAGRTSAGSAAVSPVQLREGVRRCSKRSISFTSTATRLASSRTRSGDRLLEELALDGPAWRTPASVVVERSEDFVARVEELGLEGVVAKRLSSTYLPGRRCTAWVKHKLRREERLAVTGVRRNRDGHVDAIFVARHQTDGSFTGAGAIELGLHRELVERLEIRLAELPARRAA